ncbi:hypothetical protein IF1G_04443 [Cordyceps javanica]|uniref:Uncharacterized protein n=1 Tax=Cordyceps javanica TaxID=43265 RepID=A0A545V666_9HYPO|nr:hypothetical protein IF1G_04443 [Cordyceps javanica]
MRWQRGPGSCFFFRVATSSCRIFGDEDIETKMFLVARGREGEKSYWVTGRGRRREEGRRWSWWCRWRAVSTISQLSLLIMRGAEALSLSSFLFASLHLDLGLSSPLCWASCPFLSLSCQPFAPASAPPPPGEWPRAWQFADYLFFLQIIVQNSNYNSHNPIPMPMPVPSARALAQHCLLCCPVG